MHSLSSNTNEKIVYAKKLGGCKKTRDLNGEFLVEGVRLVKEFIKHAQGDISSIFVQDGSSFIENLNDNLLDKTYIVPSHLLQKIADADTPQEVIAIAKQKPKGKAVLGDKALYLDRVQDPGNIGTIIRTAVAAGFSDIIINGSCDVYNCKVVRSTMGAIIFANIIEGNIELLKRLKAENYTILVADASGNNALTKKLSFKNPILCIGSEAFGIHPDIKQLATQLISIPMDNRVESLNAAISAAVLMYALK